MITTTERIAFISETDQSVKQRICVKSVSLMKQEQYY